MDPFLLLLAVITAAGVFWYVRNRRRPKPPEDEWVLPPDDGAPGVRAQPHAPASAQVLDRESLLHRDRTLDPSKWDNSPDELVGTDPVPPGAADTDTPAAPSGHFDRSFLENRKKPSGELGEWED